MGILTKRFGQLSSGKEVLIHQIENKNGASVEFSTLGATLRTLWIPDRNGIFADIVLGYETPEEYLHRPGNLGGSIGRYANRIRNGRFILDGKEIQITPNRGRHSIHGGAEGFDKKLWETLEIGTNYFCLGLSSPHGEEGFPGNLEVQLRVTLDDANILTLEYTAKSDLDTVCSLCNHGYFNLAGQGSGTIGGHMLRVPVEYILEIDGDRLPTGRLMPAAKTELNLWEWTRLACIFKQIGNNPLITAANGLDFTYVCGEGFYMAAEVMELTSGRRMEIWTNQPSVQVYTGGNIPGQTPGKANTRYGPFSGLCLETQQFPDAPNHPEFPGAFLRANEYFKNLTQYRFNL